MAAAARDTPFSASGSTSVGRVSTPSSTSRFHWLDLMRATAVLIVLWAHLVGGYLAQTGTTWPVSTAVDRLVLEPLAITQHGGFLGVALFFLVSGYIITRVARRESALEFSVKRLLRIYPPVFVAVALAVLVNAGVQGDRFTWPSGLELVTNVTLINYVIVPQVILVGVAWSLVVEVIFYGLTVLTRRLLTSRAIALQPLLLLSATGLTITTAGSFGDSWFLVAVSFSYIPLLVLGALFALGEDRLIAPLPLLGLAGAAWLTFLVGTQRYYPELPEPDRLLPDLRGCRPRAVQCGLPSAQSRTANRADRRRRPHELLDLSASRNHRAHSRPTPEPNLGLLPGPDCRTGSDRPRVGRELPPRRAPKPTCRCCPVAKVARNWEATQRGVS